MLKLFINEYGRLRSGWRVVIFVFAFIAALLLLVTVLRAFYVVFLELVPQAPQSRLIPEVIYRVSLLIAALGVGYLCARFLEGLPWRSLGMTLHAGWFRDLVIGCVIGFVSLAIAVGIAAAGNGLKFSINDASLLALGRSMLGSATLLCRCSPRGRSNVQRLPAANVHARSTRITRSVVDVAGIRLCSSFKSKCCRIDVCEHRSCRSLAGDGLCADEKSLAATRTALGMELGSWVVLRRADQRRYPRFKSSLQSHRCGA